MATVGEQPISSPLPMHFKKEKKKNPTLAHPQHLPPDFALALSLAGERTPCRAALGNSWLACSD